MSELWDRRLTREQALYGLSQEHRETILKMSDIQDIILCNPPSDKRYKKSQDKYLIAYTKIVDYIQRDDTNYNDEYVKTLINKLYDDIFKHRRY